MFSLGWFDRISRHGTPQPNAGAGCLYLCTKCSLAGNKLSLKYHKYLFNVFILKFRKHKLRAFSARQLHTAGISGIGCLCFSKNLDHGLVRCRSVKQNQAQKPLPKKVVIDFFYKLQSRNPQIALGKWSALAQCLLCMISW